MTDEVGRLVLADNYEQNLALASAEAVAAPLDARARVAGSGGWSDRACSTARSSSCRPRRSSRPVGRPGAGLTAPELAVLLAYTKIVLADELLDDRPARRPVPARPTCARTSRRSCAGVPRRRWTSTRCAARSSSPRSSTTWSTSPASRSSTGSARRRTRAPRSWPARTWSAARSSAPTRLIERINALDNQIDADVQTDMRLAGAHPDRAGHPLDGQQPAAAARLRGRRSSTSAPTSRRVQRAARDARRRAGRRVRRAGGTSLTERGVPDDIAVDSRCCRSRTPRSRSSRSPSATRSTRSSVAQVHADPVGAARAQRCSRRRSTPCRATTAGRRWPGPRCATTSTPCTPRSPRRCSPRPTIRGRRPTTGSRPGRPMTRVVVERATVDAGRHHRRRRRRPGAAVGRPAGDQHDAHPPYPLLSVTK